MTAKPSPITIAVIIPHPDDEAYSMAGTLALAKSWGATLHLLCVTRGESGSHRALHALTPDELGTIRQAELAQSATVLGIENVECWDWPDGKLDCLEPQKTEQKLRHWLERVEPDYVFSLGEDGVYGHRDHIYLFKRIKNSLEAIGFRGRWLTSQFPQAHFTKLWKALRRLNPNPIQTSIHATCLGQPRNQVSLVVPIDDVAQMKWNAIGAHQSQLNNGEPDSFLIPGLITPLLHEEWFQLERGTAYKNQNSPLFQAFGQQSVLHITRDYPPASKGGTSTVVDGLTSALQTNGIQNTVVSFDDWRPIANPNAPKQGIQEHRADGIRVHRIHSPTQWRQFCAASSAEDWDALHCHSAMLWELTYELSQERPNCRTIYSVHVLQEKMNQLRQLTEPTMSSTLEEAALRQADCIHAPSKAVATYLSNAIKASSGRVRLIPFGINSPDSLSRRASPISPRLLYAGRFDKLKGIQELTATLPSLLKKHPTLEIILAGGVPGNPKGDRRWRKRILSWLPSALHSRIQFKGWLAPQQMQQEMANATLLVVPSYFETFGLSALEGMRAALTVIATDVGGLTESITHEVTGLLVDSQNESALLDAIDRVLTDPELRSRLSQAAQREVEKNWYWNQRISPWLGLYYEDFKKNSAAQNRDTYAAEPLSTYLSSSTSAL